MIRITFQIAVALSMYGSSSIFTHTVVLQSTHWVCLPWVHGVWELKKRNFDLNLRVRIQKWFSCWTRFWFVLRWFALRNACYSRIDIFLSFFLAANWLLNVNSVKQMMCTQVYTSFVWAKRPFSWQFTDLPERCFPKLKIIISTEVRCCLLHLANHFHMSCFPSFDLMLIIRKAWVWR